jgi:putative peptidoglycan lipid II flippase
LSPSKTEDKSINPAAEIAPTESESSTIAGESQVQVGAATTESPAPVPTKPKRGESTASHAFLVGSGILLSRIVGLVRQRVFAYYFGTSAAKDAFDAAFKIPNFLQNVFGEGALSASFIPVYARLLARGNEEEATRVAGAILTLLALAVSVLVLLGVIATPYLIDIIAPGFEGEKRELTIRLVKIFFPGAGLLVMSAWCLGVLNSHRKFFLSYTAPVIWNVTIIAALLGFGKRVGQFPLAEIAAWASVVGSGLQFAVQFPTVMSVLKRLRPHLDIKSPDVRTVVRNFFPVFFSRGVVQISAYIDAILASFLPTGAVAALTYAQGLYTLPVSLFGMSVSAAELPAMSSATGNQEEIATELRRRLESGLRQIAFFIVPSAVAFLALGDVIVSALYRTGQFTRDDTLYVWGIIAGSSVGLLASTLGRLYSSTYYALRDTRSPLKFAIVRVILTTVLGYLFAIPLPRLLGVDQKWGVAGLTASAGIAGWVEFSLLRFYLNKKIGRTGLPMPFMAKLWSSALLGAAIGWGAKFLVGAHHPLIVAVFVLGAYGVVYILLTTAMGLPEAQTLFNRFYRIARIDRRNKR